MWIHIAFLGKHFTALITLIRLFISMNSQVLMNLLDTYKDFITLLIKTYEKKFVFNRVFILANTNSYKLIRVRNMIKLPVGSSDQLLIKCISIYYRSEIVAIIWLGIIIYDFIIFSIILQFKIIFRWRRVFYVWYLII
jgi:hypothetical protein